MLYVGAWIKLYPYFQHILFDLGKIRYVRCPQEIYWAIASFMKIGLRDSSKLGAVKFMLYVEAWIKPYPYFPHVLLDFGEIRYKKLAQNV
jgi:hypothetical protein